MTEKPPPPPEGGPDEAMLEELLSRLQGGEFARWIDLVSAVLLSVAIVPSGAAAGAVLFDELFHRHVHGREPSRGYVVPASRALLLATIEAILPEHGFIHRS